MPEQQAEIDTSCNLFAKSPTAEAPVETEPAGNRKAGFPWSHPGPSLSSVDVTATAAANPVT